MLVTSRPAISGVSSKPGAGRARALRDLEVERQVGDRAEQREADDEADRARHRERVVPEQRKRHDRLLRRGARPRRTPGRARRCSTISPMILRGAPRPGGAAEAREEDDRRERPGEEHGAQVVDRMLARAPSGCGTRRAITASAIDADRQVHVEDPAPREVVDEEAAEQRPDHRRDAEDARRRSPGTCPARAPG